VNAQCYAGAERFASLKEVVAYGFVTEYVKLCIGKILSPQIE